jgi:hypothetical protein
VDADDGDKAFRIVASAASSFEVPTTDEVQDADSSVGRFVFW